MGTPRLSHLSTKLCSMGDLTIILNFQCIYHPIIVDVSRWTVCFKPTMWEFRGLSLGEISCGTICRHMFQFILKRGSSLRGSLVAGGLYIDSDQLWDEGTPEFTLVAILESSLLFKAGMGDLTIYLTPGAPYHLWPPNHQIIVKQYGWVGYFSTNHVEL